MAGATWNCCQRESISARSVYTIQPCTTSLHAKLPRHFVQSHIRKAYVCLAVTCHVHFWQNDRGLLRATAVTGGWNEYWNKRQHRKSNVENKILPPLLQGFEPATFQSRVRRSNHWLSPLPWAIRLQSSPSQVPVRWHSQTLPGLAARKQPASEQPPVGCWTRLSRIMPRKNLFLCWWRS